MLAMVSKKNVSDTKIMVTVFLHNDLIVHNEGKSIYSTPLDNTWGTPVTYDNMDGRKLSHMYDVTYENVDLAIKYIMCSILLLKKLELLMYANLLPDELQQDASKISQEMVLAS